MPCPLFRKLVFPHCSDGLCYGSARWWGLFCGVYAEGDSPEAVIVNSMIVFLNGIRFDSIYTIDLWKRRRTALDLRRESAQLSLHRCPGKPSDIEYLTIMKIDEHLDH
jgi:hypothetical protein